MSTDLCGRTLFFFLGTCLISHVRTSQISLVILWRGSTWSRWSSWNQLRLDRLQQWAAVKDLTILLLLVHLFPLQGYNGLLNLFWHSYDISVKFITSCSIVFHSSIFILFHLSLHHSHLPVSSFTSVLAPPLYSSTIYCSHHTTSFLTAFPV